MVTKAPKKTKARNADYVAAWRACRKPALDFDGREIDLRARLNNVLKSGWSIQAVEAYAWYSCRDTRSLRPRDKRCVAAGGGMDKRRYCYPESLSQRFLALFYANQEHFAAVVK